jgi:UDP-N-acetylglucosamine--N-acetylmuramyl-(pentapeptide) pyrophosphoryl-undecaprenol N-acetylglucosamine transferase
LSIEIYIFAGGGTGGHLYPGLAVAAELQRLRPDARLVFACSEREIDSRILDPLPYAKVPQPVLPMPRGFRGWIKFLRAWTESAEQARDMVRDLKPAAVLGLGGFAAAPLVGRAARKGVRTAMLNPDAVPGRANKMLARHAQAIFTQFASTASCFSPRAQDKVRCVGCPIRSGLTAGERGKAMAHFGLDAERKTLVVLGGSLGAASINDAVTALLADMSALAGQWQVLHITGPSKAKGDILLFPPSTPQMAEGASGKVECPLFPPVKTLEYCHDMDLAYAAADLVLCRGGAVTVAELTAAAAPAIIMPYPYHKDHQQKLNAMELQAAGAGLVMEDLKEGKANAARLRDVLLPLMKEPAKLAAMKAAASGLGKQNAAAEVAAWMAGKER